MRNNPTTILNRTDCFEIAALAGHLLTQIDSCEKDIEKINRRIGGTGGVRTTITDGRISDHEVVPPSDRLSVEKIEDLLSELDEKESDIAKLRSKLDEARAEFGMNGCSVIIPFPG